MLSLTAILKIIGLCTAWYVIGFVAVALICASKTVTRWMEPWDRFLQRHKWLDMPALIVTAFVLMGPFGLLHVAAMEWLYRRG